MVDNPKGPNAGKATQKDGDKGDPVGLEELAKGLATFKDEVVKQVQGIRQLVNQRDEVMKDTLENLVAAGGRSRTRKSRDDDDRLDDDYDEDLDDEDRFSESRRGKRRHPLLRHVERERKESRERDDVIMQGNAVTSFLVESDPGDPAKKIPPENRKSYLPKIEEILNDRNRRGRFVHREADGTPNYRLTLDNVYDHLKLGEYHEAKSKADEEKIKQAKERGDVDVMSYIPGGDSDADEPKPDTSGMTSDQMLEEGVAPVSTENPPKPLYPDSK